MYRSASTLPSITSHIFTTYFTKEDHLEKSGLTTASKFLKTAWVPAGGKRQQRSSVRAVRGCGPGRPEGSAMPGCTRSALPSGWETDPAGPAALASSPGRCDWSFQRCFNIARTPSSAAQAGCQAQALPCSTAAPAIHRLRGFPCAAGEGLSWREHGTAARKWAAANRLLIICCNSWTVSFTHARTPKLLQVCREIQWEIKVSQVTWSFQRKVQPSWEYIAIAPHLKHTQQT